MAITNQERVGQAMELHCAGLAPFVEREFINLHQAQAAEAARRYFGEDRTVGKKPVADWDVAALLKLMWEAWNDAAAELVAKLGAKAEIARELAYRLHTLCERKKRAAEALAYNGLVQNWPEIVRLAHEGAKPVPEQTTMFEKEE